MYSIFAGLVCRSAMSSQLAMTSQPTLADVSWLIARQQPASAHCCSQAAAVSICCTASCRTKIRTAPQGRHGARATPGDGKAQNWLHGSPDAGPTVDLAPLTAQVATTNWRSAVGARRSYAVPADCSRLWAYTSAKHSTKTTTATHITS